jgi:hypothetical protein
MNSDSIRTVRPIVCQIGEVTNGLVASSRFWEISHADDNAGEVILFESKKGESQPGMRNNAFIQCRMQGCSGPGISLFGGGMNHNTFWDVTAHTLAGSVFLNAESGSIHNNEFQVIEMDAGLRVQGECWGNSFNQIVARRMPLSFGNADANTLNYRDPDLPGNQRATFRDTSSAPASRPSNIYRALWEASPTELVPVLAFPDGRRAAPG